MEKKTFFRVANISSDQGLWYDKGGVFTGLIHEKFKFCKNTDLPMPFDPTIIGWLSATLTLEELYQWFPVEDILLLEGWGFFVSEYESSEYRHHNNHWIIKDEASFLIRRIPMDELLLCK